MNQLLMPVAVAALSLSAIITFLLGVLNNPSGFWNQLIISAIDIISPIFPETPEFFRIRFLVDSLIDVVPGFSILGTQIIESTLAAVAQIFALFSTVQIYKLLPFKFS